MLASSVSHTHSARDPLLQAFFAHPQIPGSDDDHATVQFQDLPLKAQRAVRAYLDDASSEGPVDDRPEWTEEDVVHLHWRLLLELRRLPDPETPLEEKLDTLAWALTDSALDGRPTPGRGPATRRQSAPGPARWPRAACQSPETPSARR